jgi:hypothetical protein
MTTTTIDEATGEIIDEPRTVELATAPDASGVDLADAPLNWPALVRISDTAFVPRALRGDPNAVLAAVFSGREVGLSPMASLRLVDIIDGTPSFSAELTVALIRAAGHRIALISESSESITVEGIRGGDPQDSMTITYSLTDAERAGLVTIDDDGRPRSRSRNGKKLPWETFTSDLLWARAVSRLARRMFPDVTATPSRTAVASFVTDTTPAIAARAMPVDEAVYRLGVLLEQAVPSTGVDAEVFLRSICRLAVAAEVVDRDLLPGILAGFGAVHVADLKAAEIQHAATVARAMIGAAYSASVGRDITDEPVFDAEEAGL